MQCRYCGHYCFSRLADDTFPRLCSNCGCPFRFPLNQERMLLPKVDVIKASHREGIGAFLLKLCNKLPSFLVKKHPSPLDTQITRDYSSVSMKVIPIGSQGGKALSSLSSHRFNLGDEAWLRSEPIKSSPIFRGVMAEG